MRCDALKVGLLTIVVAAVVTASASSQPLKGRSEIELSFGLMEQGTFEEEYYDGGVVDKTGLDDMFVKIGFNHWLEEDLAFSFMISALASEITDRSDWYYYDREEMAVVSIFSGIRYYLHNPRRFSPWRPYFAFAVGPVIGSTVKSIAGGRVYNEERTLAAFGGYFGGGIDFQVSRRFMFGINGGYTAMSNFEEPVGGKTNYSGAQFGISFGFLFGRARY
jgi:hypothetical protein